MSIACQFILFSGKGGVGKTTMAAATAVRHARRGQRTLIVTTDPASNLADVFEQPIGHQITAIRGVDHLWAMEIDPDAAADEYRARILTPMRSVLPDDVVRVVEEQLRSPCTAEIAAFDRFVDFMETGGFEVVIFDTAPTGHTLRLLELPVEWSRFIDVSAQGSGQTCLGPVGAIQAAKEKYDHAIAALRDSGRTRFVFVLHPEALSIYETRRALRELETLGISGAELIVNGVLPEEVCEARLFRHRHAMQQRYLDEISETFQNPTRRMYLWDGEVKGITRLSTMADYLEQPGMQARYETTDGAVSSVPVTEFGVLDPRGLDLLRPGAGPKAIFVAGKGGVGKTTVASAIAAHLADEGSRTLLVTTDPAAHLGEVFGVPVGDEPAPLAGIRNLWAVRVDQASAATRYKSRILEEAKDRYSPEMLAALREELESPCTEEIAVFDEFARYLDGAGFDVTVFDTAPTGHTLRLLELPFDYRGQVELMVTTSTEGADRKAAAETRYDRLIARLRDPVRTVFTFVVYPEATPVLEADRAMQDLAGAGIPTQVVVVNFLLPEDACTNDYFRRRRAMQLRYLQDIRDRFRCALLPLPLLDGEVRGVGQVRLAAQALLGDGLVAEQSGMYAVVQREAVG